MRLLRQFSSLFIFFLMKRFHTCKKYQTQQKRFLPLSLCMQKIAAFVVFYSPIFICEGFLCVKFFVKSKTGLKIVLIASITHTTDVYPYRPTYQEFVRIYFYPIICENLFYENLFEPFLTVRIFSPYENFFESFLFVKISSYLQSSV